MVRTNARVSVASVLSVTLAVKLKVPAIAGVPEIMPAASRLSPVGKPPLIIVHA